MLLITPAEHSAGTRFATLYLVGSEPRYLYTNHMMHLITLALLDASPHSCGDPVLVTKLLVCHWARASLADGQMLSHRMGRRCERGVRARSPAAGCRGQPSNAAWPYGLAAQVQGKLLRLLRHPSAAH